MSDEDFRSEQAAIRATVAHKRIGASGRREARRREPLSPLCTTEYINRASVARARHRTSAELPMTPRQHYIGK